MGLFNNTQFNNLDDLFLHQLEDLYDAERRLVGALPKMCDAATSTRLAKAFRDHQAETENHVKRLEHVFALLGKEPERETCPAMKGLIEEAETMINAKGDDTTRDAALVAAAQRVEHYEMAGYGTARALAQQIGRDDAADLLQQTLDEEKAADKLLTQIAEDGVNVAAARAKR
jgi:ferritin-like metal-binding protein YciE